MSADLLQLASTSLDVLIALPDEEAAASLEQRMLLLDQVDQIHERSYFERGEIAVQFEKRELWRHLLNPNSHEPFISFSAWMACSHLGGRRVNFESKKDVEALKDIPADKLRGVTKGNIKVLKQLSTAVRNDEAILVAAKTLPEKDFLAKLQAEHPNQHVEIRKALRFFPVASEAVKVEEAVAWAIEREIAGNRDDAIVRIAEVALGVFHLEAEAEQADVKAEPR